MRSKLTAEDRFWAKVDKTETCWLWTSTQRSTGYGSFWFDGGYVSAHRYAYELLVGPIPGGFQLDHLCRVRLCVRPGHLEPVTCWENINRSPLANAHKEECPHGHAYDKANTRHYRGKRFCRACNAACQRALRELRRQTA